MKKNFLIAKKNSVLSTLLVGSFFAWGILTRPAIARAEEHRGDQGVARSFSAGRGSAGRQTSPGERGFSSGRTSSGVRGGRDFDGRVGDGDRDRDRSRGGFSFGFYSAPRTYGFDYSPYAYAPSYSYAPSSCNPPGFFDQAGYWHAYPGCDANPYGY